MRRHACILALASCACGSHAAVPAARVPGAHPAPAVRAAPRAAGPLHLDQRYQHDHYYPRAGYVVNALPAGSVRVGWRGGNWWVHGGVWFRPSGSHFVVAVPPHGIVAPVLPPAFVTLWIGGEPYYYANGIYYAQAPQGFLVVDAPAGVEGAQPLPAPPASIIYPRLGQSTAQAEADRAACNDWTASQGANRDPVTFQRAFEACMEGRGYVVR